MAARPSPAAPLSLAAALGANPGIFELPTRPRAVVDQGQVECCVSAALAGAMEVLHPAWPPLAPMFHYHVTRYNNHGADAQGFLYLQDALSTLTNQGICRQVDHPVPYTRDAAALNPSPDAYADALTRRVELQGLFFGYEDIGGASRVTSIRAALRGGCPVVLGFTLPEGYPVTFLNGRLEWLSPATPPPSSTGHCVLILGFDDVRGVLQVQDSRGGQSFQGGRWWMGYHVVESATVIEVYRLMNPI